MRRRAFGLRPMPPLVSRPSGFNPSRLRTGSAARSACGFCCMVPATMGKTLACATACCTRLRESVPSSMLALGRPHVTEGCSPARRTVWQDFHSAPALCCRRSGREAFLPVVREQGACQDQGICRHSRSAGMPGQPCHLSGQVGLCASLACRES